MKFTIQILFIVLLAFILELFLPWWSIAIAAFAGGMIFNTRANFGAGFIAIALLWTIKALIIESNAAATLTDRVASIFMLNKPSLFLVMAVLGGLVGGFAAMTGAALHGKKKKYYS
ncbi:MAG TPA: hypothetical protein VGD31_07300 [Sphingobacteriaceae bacterium]